MGGRAWGRRGSWHARRLPSSPPRQLPSSNGGAQQFGPDPGASVSLIDVQGRRQPSCGCDCACRASSARRKRRGCGRWWRRRGPSGRRLAPRWAACLPPARTAGGRSGERPAQLFSALPLALSQQVSRGASCTVRGCAGPPCSTVCSCSLPGSGSMGLWGGVEEISERLAGQAGQFWGRCVLSLG